MFNCFFASEIYGFDTKVQHTWKITTNYCKRRIRGRRQNSRFLWIPCIRDFRIVWPWKYELSALRFHI